MQVFPEPRAGGLSVHHEIVPEGQQASDLANQDFCFYDILEPMHAPELVKEEQEKLD